MPQSEARRVDKPWGYELIWARTDKYTGKILHINKGESLSLQYHRRKDETLYLLNGRVRLTLEKNSDRRSLEMKVGEAFHIPPHLIHRMEALEDSDLLEASTHELNDVVRLEDDFGRKGTSAP